MAAGPKNADDVLMDILATIYMQWEYTHFTRVSRHCIPEQYPGTQDPAGSLNETDDRMSPDLPTDLQGAAQEQLWGPLYVPNGYRGGWFLFPSL